MPTPRTPGRRYAVVGLGSRSRMYTRALLTTFRDDAELAALCDPNTARMSFHNDAFERDHDHPAVPCYAPGDFRAMLDAERIDTVIVTSVDRTHADYIVAALDSGRDVITEKPMTVTARQCRDVLAASRRNPGRLTVAFNYRYAPRNSRVRELLAGGAIGDVLSVHFEWLLDTRHGADYFRRWHRDKTNSGGLLVHKASHHFDLVNWWLGARPELVFALGGTVFYGRANAEARGLRTPYHRSTGAADPRSDPWALDLASDPTLRGLYLDAEHEDGYLRDQNVFGDGISIEDDMAVLVGYDSGATMSYHLSAYAPWEGYRVMFNGSRGRLELDVKERPYVSGAGADTDPTAQAAAEASTRLSLHPLWQRPSELAVDVDERAGAHGGGDERLLRDLFAPGTVADDLGRAAGPLDGAYAALTGVAANTALATARPVPVRSLLDPDALP